MRAELLGSHYRCVLLGDAKDLPGYFRIFFDCYQGYWSIVYS